jgi:hypothetical protein
MFSSLSIDAILYLIMTVPFFVSNILIQTSHNINFRRLMRKYNAIAEERGYSQVEYKREKVNLKKTLCNIVAPLIPVINAGYVIFNFINCLEKTRELEEGLEQIESKSIYVSLHEEAYAKDHADSNLSELKQEKPIIKICREDLTQEQRSDGYHIISPKVLEKIRPYYIK